MRVPHSLQPHELQKASLSFPPLIIKIPLHAPSHPLITSPPSLPTINTHFHKTYTLNNLTPFHSSSTILTMADTMDPENAAFWLPSHFLTDDDDFLSDNHHHHHHRNSAFDALSSLDSPVSSTETERGDSTLNDDDDFLADLSRHLAQSSLHDPTTTTNEKPWVFSTSPQSTLSGFGPCSNNRSGFSSNGSPNGPSRVPSPPVTPPAKNDAAWELLYEAAGQVARLKMNALAAQIHHHNHQQQQSNRGLLAQPRNVSLPSKPHLNSFYDFPPTSQYEEVKRQRSGGNFYCQHHHHQQRRGCGGGPLGLPQSAWPPLRPNHHHRQPSNGPPMRAVFLNGPGSGPMQGIKRQSTGTGVFLPRRAGTTTHQPPPPEPRKKPTGCSPVLLPARVVHALNLDLEEMNNGVNVNSQSRFGSGMLSEHDIIMARRNAILEQQRRNAVRNEGAAATMAGHEIRLPSDWTY